MLCLAFPFYGCKFCKDLDPQPVCLCLLPVRMYSYNRFTSSAFVFEPFPVSPQHLNQNLSSEIFNSSGFLRRREAPGISFSMKYQRTRHCIQKETCDLLVFLTSFSCNSIQDYRNLFMLGLQGVRLCTAEVRCVLEICTTRPQFLHMSCFFDNEHVLHAPEEE